MTMVWGIVRALLSALGSYLATVGVLNQEQIEPAIGGTLVLAAAVWSVVEKKQALKKDNT